MCIKLGSDELETVRNLMRMSLMAVVAEALEVDIDRLEGGLGLRRDLGMDTAAARRLQRLIAEYFDGFSVDPEQCDTLDSLLERVLEQQFDRAA